MKGSLRMYGGWILKACSAKTLLTIVLCANLLAVVVVLRKNVLEDVPTLENSREKVSIRAEAGTVQRSELFTEPHLDCRVPAPLKAIREVDLSQGRQNVDIAWGVYKSLSKYSLRKVQKFVLVVGNGGTLDGLLGTMLNAHPHAVVAPLPKLLFSLGESAHELGEEEQLLFYNQISRYAFSRAHMLLHESEKHGGSSDDWRYGIIPNMYAGVYEGHINIIGLDVGVSFADVGAHSVDMIDHAIKSLFALINVPIVVLHEIENPFDSISLLACKMFLTNQSMSEAEVLDKAMNKYFSSMELLSKFQEMHSYIKFFHIHVSDLEDKPVKAIQSVCHQLGVFCSDDYTLGSAHMLLKKEQDYRMLINWSDKIVKKIQMGIAQFAYLHRYNLTSNSTS